VVITGSEFERNTGGYDDGKKGGGNNIYVMNRSVTCNDGNTFESSGGGSKNDSDGNYPADVCDE
jgi:hypothetical protein